MSRRESRTSMNNRQHDALFEFENFKKKFLLANKHITKLNSTLSVRIEELNAQISTLYVENLRLRASEIALVAQLKREREKSQKIMADTEAATTNLTKHLSYLRNSLNIKPSPLPQPASSPSPRTQRPTINITTSPTAIQGNRVSRPPNVPGIYEENEPCLSSSDKEEKQPSPSQRKSKSKPRLSASKLPLPSRGTSPTLSAPPPMINLMDSELTKRKPSRRQSGLLTVNTDVLSVPRASSPAFGSPIRLEAGRAEEEEELAAISGFMNVDVTEPEVQVQDPTPKKRKSKFKERDSEGEKEIVVENPRPREKKRQRDADDGTDAATKLRLKDVTNSRMALQSIDNTVYDQVDAEKISAKNLLSPSPQSSSQSTSRGSSSPTPPDSETGGGGGRERRTRKSVNYAEPKLNTKMRKPDPQPGAEPTRARKRSSAAAVMTSTVYKPGEDNGNDADNDTEARSSVELPLRVNGNYINPEKFPMPSMRPTLNEPMYSPGPPSRSNGSSSPSGRTSLKRKKSRPRLVMDDDDEDSDGTQADAEYIPGGKLGIIGWVNIEGRKKMGTAKRSIAVVDDDGPRIQDLNGRRHSTAM